jgi:hypothetical protein
MKSAPLLVAALALVAMAAACDQTGQRQAQQGELQKPGERPAPRAGLNVPPDVWLGPPRPSALATPGLVP